MDNVVYIAANGAKNTMHLQAVTANNLANVSTTGFKADLARLSSKQVTGDGYNSWALSVAERTGINMSEGTVVNTGRALDVAVIGKGLIAIQSPSGKEVYTRAGSLMVTSTGQLVTKSGRPVLGTGGPISVPPFEKIDIGKDGTVTIRPNGQEANVLTVVGRIKLVVTDGKEMVKGAEGSLVTADGSQLQADASVKLSSGALESSNVNAVGSLVSMIELSRHYEMLIKLMKTADNNAEKAGQLMRLG
jgi:flagellar basal-body rod protein FlgF